MIIDIYSNSDGSQITALPRDASDNTKSVCISSTDKLLKTIEGEDWDDCMRQYHEFMNWEPYVPMKE